MIINKSSISLEDYKEELRGQGYVPTDEQELGYFLHTNPAEFSGGNFYIPRFLTKDLQFPGRNTEKESTLVGVFEGDPFDKGEVEEGNISTPVIFRVAMEMVQVRVTASGRNYSTGVRITASPSVIPELIVLDNGTAYSIKITLTWE